MRGRRPPALLFSLAALFFALTPAQVRAAIEADLLAAYAPSYAASVGGDDNAEVIIANAVAGNNLINDQSGTGARLRIAGFYRSANDPLNWTTTGGMVGWLANNDSRVADVVAQGALAGADLVTYIVQNSDSGSIAAVAQQPGMFSVHNPGAVWSAVVAHEIGHNYGRSHSDGLLNPKTVMLHNYCSGGAAPPFFFSNPNLWFHGVQLQGTGDNCGQGPLINGGDNSAPGAQAVADRRDRVVTGPALDNVVLRWRFTNAPGAAPAGSVIRDLVSGAPAVVRGNGGAFTGRGLRIPGGSTGNTAMNSMAAYIDLPNGILSSRTNLTIEIWAAPLSARNWARIADFGRAAQAGDGLGAPGEYTGAPGAPAPGATAASDNLMLSAAIGASLNGQRFEARLDNAAVTLDSSLPTAAGLAHHYVITFTAGEGAFPATGGRWRWYRDGHPAAFLDANFLPSAIEDVNNWLGRSQWSADDLAHNEYAEVRVSNIALTPRQVLANFLIGPNFFPAAAVTLTNSDLRGSTSFNAAGQWSGGEAPAAGQHYETLNFLLRTPAASGSHTFAGASLRVTGGSLLWHGAAGGVTTIGNLILNGGAAVHAGSGAWTLAGNLGVTTNGGLINSVNGVTTLSANLSGAGPLSFFGAAATLAGNNSAFTGQIRVGNGQPGALVIDSPARLGAAPSSFAPDRLVLNRGTLQTTATMALDDPNRGILLDISGGTFNVTAGATLTLASPLASPSAPAGVHAGSLRKAGLGTLVLAGPGTAFTGGFFADSGSATANDGAVRVANPTVLANARSPIFIRNNNSGSSTLQIDGRFGSITLPQTVSLAGRNSPVAAIQNVAGTNTIGGGVTVHVGGGNYWIQSDAGRLNLGGTLASAATGVRTLTFQGAGDINVTGVIANGSATVNVTKAGAGTLTLGGNNTYSGVTAVSAGALIVNGITSTGAVAVANNATLGGAGAIGGTVTLQAGGNLAPGADGIGRLTVSNNVTLQPGGFTRMELNAAAGAHDVLRVTGVLGLNGTLVVSNLGGALAGGRSFPLFQAAGFSGAFASFALPALPAPLAWDVSTLGSDGVLRVVSVVNMNPAPIIASHSGGLLSLSWPADRTGWRLQTQTNPLDTGLGAAWFDVPGAAATNAVSLPINPADPSVFFRLVYP